MQAHSLVVSRPTPWMASSPRPLLCHHMSIARSNACRGKMGAMTLREFTGSLTVGQQQPLVRMPNPIPDASDEKQVRGGGGVVARGCAQHSLHPPLPQGASAPQMSSPFPSVHTPSW